MRVRPAEHGQDAAFTQRDQRFETIAYLPRYWNFESIPLQRGVMQTIGSALGDEVSISEIGVGSSFDADSHLSRGAD